MYKWTRTLLHQFQVLDKFQAENITRMSWLRLIRFEDNAGQVKFGEPIVDTADDLKTLLAQGKLSAKVFAGDGPFDLKSTSQEAKVELLLPLLYPSDVPIIKCIGLNYVKHSKLIELRGGLP
jgi:hypothetical protein